MNWRQIVVHHSATGSGVTAGQIREFHVRERGWKDIGYHGVVLGAPHDFAAVPGRRLTMPGAHTAGQNLWSLGLCLVGNFVDAPPPLEQIMSAAKLAAEWCDEFGIGPMAIHPHRKFKATECPGRVDIDDLRARVGYYLKQV